MTNVFRQPLVCRIDSFSTSLFVFHFAPRYVRHPSRCDLERVCKVLGIFSVSRFALREDRDGEAVLKIGEFENLRVSCHRSLLLLGTNARGGHSPHRCMLAVSGAQRRESVALDNLASRHRIRRRRRVLDAVIAAPSRVLKPPQSSVFQQLRPDRPPTGGPLATSAASDSLFADCQSQSTGQSLEERA